MTGSMANRISGLLAERSMTQKELAFTAQIAEGMVSLYMNGERVPRGIHLIKIAKALGTTVDCLTNQYEVKVYGFFKA